MEKLVSCEITMDNACVELKFTDGSMIAIDTAIQTSTKLLGLSDERKYKEQER